MDLRGFPNECTLSTAIVDYEIHFIVAKRIHR
jgi:hypothetical protein